MHPPADKPLILVVDDDADAVFLIRRLLTRSQVEHDCLHLGDGEKAIEYLTACSVEASQVRRPSAMLLDVKMPKVGGFEVLEWVRARPGPVLPVMMLTTSDDPRDKERAEQLCADGYTAKFPTVDELREQLEKLLTRSIDSTLERW